jgi:hypothetical protein
MPDQVRFDQVLGNTCRFLLGTTCRGKEGVGVLFQVIMLENHWSSLPGKKVK